MRYPAITALVLIVAAAGVAGQNSAPSFDAVSIKVDDSGRDGGGSTPLRNGRWSATNVSAVGLIASAWRIDFFDRILSVPEWARVTHYDIAAVAPASTTPAELGPMLQAMLRDRFKVAVHVEQRDLPVYNLVRIRPDGKPGPGLKPASIDCRRPDWREQIKDKPSARPCGFSWDTGMLTGGGEDMATIAGLLVGEAGRPVFDKTGFDGRFDFDLKWTPGLGPDATGNTISIFTALQDQFGVKLESATAPLEVLIVDHIEKPTPN